MTQLILNRRRFLATGSALVAGASLMPSPLISSAHAVDTSGYKALICIFLYGGLDQADVVLPFDQTNYDRLAAIRPGLFDAYGVGAGNTSRDRGNLLEIIPDKLLTKPRNYYNIPDNIVNFAIHEEITINATKTFINYLFCFINHPQFCSNW